MLGKNLIKDTEGYPFGCFMTFSRTESKARVRLPQVISLLPHYPLVLFSNFSLVLLFETVKEVFTSHTFQRLIYV